MPKTFASLWPHFVSWENWLLAYRRCRRRKRFKRAACEFDFAWESNLHDLHQDVSNHEWIPGEYHNFRILDPKPRLISAAPFRDRIVHHAIVNVLEPIFERRFIFDSYACRRGKGTHRAQRRAQYYLRRHAFYLKTDIVKFFPSVDHEVLLTTVSHVVRDSRMLDLIETVLASGLSVPAEPLPPAWFPGDDLFSVLRSKGLPIGNLTSQFFANVLLDPVDHVIKETWRVPGYVRYADDLILFADSKKELRETKSRLQGKLATLRLRLHSNKTHIGRSTHGVRFLGARIFPDQRRLTQTTLARMRIRIRQWRRLARLGELDFDQVRMSLRAWIAHAANSNSTGIRRDVLRSIRLRRAGDRT